MRDSDRLRDRAARLLALALKAREDDKLLCRQKSSSWRPRLLTKPTRWIGGTCKCSTSSRRTSNPRSNSSSSNPDLTQKPTCRPAPSAGRDCRPYDASRLGAFAGGEWASASSIMNSLTRNTVLLAYPRQ